MKIDTKAIQAELDALVNPVFTDEKGQPIPRRKDSIVKVVVKVDKQMTTKVGIDYREVGGKDSITVRLNRPKIRNQAQLDGIMAWLKTEVTM